MTRDAAAEAMPKMAPETPDPGHSQPETAEVESARLLANDAHVLRSDGLDDDEIRRLADEFIAKDLGTDLDTFVAWARSHPERA